MMSILSSLIFALSANSDALVIGISYGIKKIRINVVGNIVVSLIAGAGTFCSMLFGQIINIHISLRMRDFIGSLLLILFGIYMLAVTVRKRKIGLDRIADDESSSQSNYISKALNHPEIIDTNHSNMIELKEALVLGGLLCINNIGMGIGAGITGLNIDITTFFSFIFSIVFLQVGCHMGQKVIPDRLSVLAEIISASIIIILGMYEVFI